MFPQTVSPEQSKARVLKISSHLVASSLLPVWVLEARKWASCRSWLRGLLFRNLFLPLVQRISSPSLPMGALLCGRHCKQHQRKKIKPLCVWLRPCLPFPFQRIRYQKVHILSCLVNGSMNENHGTGAIYVLVNRLSEYNAHQMQRMSILNFVYC